MDTGKLLVVEDDDTIRRLLVEFFRERASLVDSARDGAEALHRINTAAYDVVVLDMVMPHMTGIDLLHSLDTMCRDRRKPLLNPPAVVVVTSTPEHELPDDVLLDFRNLVIGVFRKPVDVKAVALCIESHRN